MLVLAIAFTVAACGDKPTEDPPEEPDGGTETVTLTPNQALDRMYEGILSGGEAMAAKTSYGVENVYTVFSSMLNYTVTYKANYDENNADSEIFVSIFDNSAYLDRATFYYDGLDLYYRSAEGNYVISNFSTSMMFNVFFEFCQTLDISDVFFSETVGTIFNRNNNGVNLGLLLYADNIDYTRSGEDRDNITLSDIDLSILNDTLGVLMDNTFGSFSDKFDLITQKYFNFKLSRLLESRFSRINAEEISMNMTKEVATFTHWRVSGTLQDASAYWAEADIGYNDGDVALEEGSDFRKSQFTEATLGKNRFFGTMLIPAVSDELFDAEIITNINTFDNSLNEASMTISDAQGTNFFAGYYKGELAFVDTTGFCEWLDGAIDLAAFNLPKVYFDNIDLTKLINAGYNNLVKAMLVMLEGMSGDIGTPENEELFNIILENFGNDGESVIWYRITEELIQKIRGDEESLMTIVAEALGVDQSRLESYLGEDFFSSAELIISYNLDTGVITLTMNLREEMLFEMTLIREPFDGISFPPDANLESSAYSKFNIPDVTTMEIDVSFNVRNGKTETDMSTLLGVFIGDVTGINSQRLLRNTETLILRGTVTEKYIGNADGQIISANSVNIDVYLRNNSGTETLMMNVCTNPSDINELLITYLFPLGDRPEGTEFKYRIDKNVIKEGFSQLLGEDNIFDENSLLTILDKVLNSDGISAISKNDGWFYFSLVVSDEADPVYELIGLKNTTATVKARILFTGIEKDIDVNEYFRPVITKPDDVTVESMYSPGSAWRENAEVVIGREVIRMKPTYSAESINIVTGKAVYSPSAFLFGEEYTYNLFIYSETGTYKVERLDLPDNSLFIDPAFTNTLPTKIPVFFDNGQQGQLDCVIEGFSPDNVTNAGYNMKGIAGEPDESMLYRIIVGKDSIMTMESEIYIFVHSRKVIPVKDSSGKELYDTNGVPVVGQVSIDPYSYAMKKQDFPEYDPISEWILRNGTELRFDGVYGYEQIPSGDTFVEKELSYDIEGYNRFSLASLDPEWEYDYSKISWRGGTGYAYAYYGDTVAGNAVRIALEVKVIAQTVDSVRIDDENSGTYTIDFLVKSTYTIPSCSGVDHTVKLAFVGADTSAPKTRTLVVARPDGLTDDEYYDNYLTVSLEWAGAAEIASNPSVIGVNGTTTLFGQDNHTTAVFGADLGVGEQTVGLNVIVPSRYLGSEDEESYYAANFCETIDGIPSYTSTTLKISKAAFYEENGTYAFYEPFLYNPYDSALRIPTEIYLEVDKTKTLGSNPERIVKKYPVNWVTTDKDGKELNLFEQDEEGLFRLANPVTYEQDMVIYGKIGDRGGDDGYIWITMGVRNLASELASIEYDGLEAGQTSIDIDPYLPYTLPDGFIAVLESGKTIEAHGIEWEVSVDDGGDRVWYPVNYKEGCDTRYYKDGKYVFSYSGGKYVIRYVIEGGSDVIRQELTLEVNVASRTLKDKLVNIYNDGNQPTEGYADINYYREESTLLYERLLSLSADGSLPVGVVFAEMMTSGVYTLYELAVDWTRAAEGESGYENSLDRLLSLLQAGASGESMTLIGTIYTGTINEQTLYIDFSFGNYVLESIVLDRFFTAMDSGAITVDNYDEKTGVSYASLGEEDKTLVINLAKPFGLTLSTESGVASYASPYDYLVYALGQIKLMFANGTSEQTVPVLNFGMTKEEFNTAILNPYGLSEGDGTENSLTIVKLSAGSALNEITVLIRSVKDGTIDTALAYTAELFKEDAQLYTDVMPLPSYVEVNYTYSGKVIYLTDEWTVMPESKPYFDDEKVSGISTALINPLLKQPTASQTSNYRFSYVLPDIGSEYFLDVHIPKKDLRKTEYYADGETDLYDIKDGVLTMSNPYLYYDESFEYGFDTTKIPTVINANGSDDYEFTSLNSHYVAWTFVAGLTPDLIAEGTDKLLIATATIQSYCDEKGEQQNQTVELYLKVMAMEYYGIEYGLLPVTNAAPSFGGLKNWIVIDPYDDVMEYRGNFVLPTNGLKVLFNGGADGYTFNDVRYKLCDAKGVEFADYITNIPYDEKGHTLPYENLPDGYLRLKMYIPGSELDVYVEIKQRIISEVWLSNSSFDALGAKIGEEDLPALYYIDPYNNYTYQLPVSAKIRFINEEGGDLRDYTVSGWEIYDEATGSFRAFNTNDNFYSRQSDNNLSVNYAFFRLTENLVGGSIYRMRGYISLGNTSTGTSGRQYFEVAVVVLNRSLVQDYTTSYRFDDPFGGILADIPGELNERMFVDYDSYYSEYFAENGISEEYYYSRFSSPVLPEVNWAVYNDNSVIDYKGGFDKEITGNVYADNTHRAILYKEFSAQEELNYGELVKALAWDGYFTAAGNPQAYYGDSTKSNLRILASDLEKDVVFRTYSLTVNSLSGGSEEEKQYANFMENGFANEIKASGITEPRDIANEMFRLSKEAYDLWQSVEGAITPKAAIYRAWKVIYDSYKSAGSATSPNLSDYQKLKVSYYEKANGTPSSFTASEQKENAQRENTLKNGLNVYINASIWDLLYDRATENERERMDVFLVGSTVQAKSNALILFLYDDVARLGSIGETATAHITAPTSELGQIYDENGEVLTEFVFNIYSTLAFINEVSVEVILNYASVFDKYIEEGLALAWEKYRAQGVGESLTEYVKRITAEYVNAIVPMVEIPGSGGQKKPLIGFTYDNYDPNYADNLEYWNALHDYKKSEATKYITELETACGGDAEAMWLMAYEKHTIEQDSFWLARMDEILRDAQSGTGDIYTNAFEKYKTEYTSYVTADMDVHYDAAEKEQSVAVVDAILNKSGTLSYLSTKYGGYDVLFSKAYGSVAVEIYDLIEQIFSENHLDYIEGRYGQFYDAGRTIFDLIDNTNTPEDVRTTVNNLLFWKLGGYGAYETLYENSELIGFSETMMDYLYTLACDETNGLFVSGNFTSDVFGSVKDTEEYKKTVLFLEVQNYFEGDTTKQAYLDAWAYDAVLDAKAAVYSTLYDYFYTLGDEEGRADAAKLDEIRNTGNIIEKQAFVKYVEYRKSLGEAENQTISDLKSLSDEKAVFTASYETVLYLKSEDSSFAYKDYLTDYDKPSVKERALTEIIAREYFSAEERKAFEFYLSQGYGYAEIYDLLVSRQDLVSATEILEEGYYFAVIQQALDRVKAECERYVDELDWNSPELETVKKTFEDYFTDIASNGSLSLEGSSLIETPTKEYYAQTLYKQSIASYTGYVETIVSGNASAASDYAYSVVYENNKDLFDQILSRYYEKLKSDNPTAARLNYDAFRNLVSLMEQDELAYYYNAVEEVTSGVAKDSVYQLLGFYNDSVKAEQTAKKYFDAYSEAYLTLTQTEGINKEELDLIVNPSLFEKAENETYLDKLADIEELYRVKIGMTAVPDELKEALGTFFAALENASEPSGAETAGTDGTITALIDAAVGQNMFENQKLDDYSVTQALERMKFLAALEKAADGIDPGLEGIYYSAAFVDVLQKTLTDCRLETAANYIKGLVAERTADYDNMTEAEENYEYLSSLIIENLLLSGDHASVSALDKPDEPVTPSVYKQSKIDKVEEWLSGYEEQAGGNREDASYEIVFSSMRDDTTKEVTFYTEDNLPSSVSDDNRYVVVFDKSGLTQGEEMSAIAPVYLVNEYKVSDGDYSDAYKVDGITYIYKQYKISYVDFTGEVAFDEVMTSDDVNYMEIDPLAPFFPTKVRAYATYETGTSGGTTETALVDMGEVSVEYHELFFENNYSGTDILENNYVVYLIDSKGHRDELVIKVKYLDRTVDAVYVENGFYGGSQVSGGDRDGYYNLKENNVNRMVIDPTNGNILDVENRSYIMPDLVSVDFSDGVSATFENVVWDMSEIAYSLDGRSNLKMRILSYETTGQDGNTYLYEYLYSENKLRITSYDDQGNAVGLVRVMNNVPDYSIWNTELDITERNINTLSTYDAVTGESVELGKYVSYPSGSYIDVSSDVYTVNPFDIIYPGNCKITFNGGGDENVEITDWALEPGNEGVYKVMDIILGKAFDNYIIANFTYLGYTVRVRFLADNIELEGLEEGEYIDGGTIYLVRNGGSADEQIKQNYTYFYYNFSTDSARPDYRKVPITFPSGTLNEISTTAVRTYSEVRAVLGWDSAKYPDLNVSPNIEFTVAIVEPVMYAKLDGEYNAFVELDFISMPHDSNFQKKNDAGEPEGAEYFVQIYNGVETYFRIDKDSISYDIINSVVYYNCEFELTSTNRNLFASADGGKVMTFTVAVPLESYLYTEVSGVTFDKTPIKDNFGQDIWSWTTVDVNSPEYRDGIYWPLGRSLKASLLPKAVTENGETISLLWDLEGINVNMATDANGYVATAYYFDADNVWKSMELRIYIEKIDISEQIIAALGDSQTMTKRYDGHYYSLPLDLNAEIMKVLRFDGTTGALDESSVIIEYKLASAPDREYSSDPSSRPLNTGLYSIRVRVEDYNAILNGELIFTLQVEAYLINANDITFDSANANTVLYTYDGTAKGLIVTGGLSYVKPDNWFVSREEKEALVNAEVSAGFDLITAKARAYRTLYTRVTEQTRIYLDGYTATVKAETGLAGDELTAAVYDRLEIDLEICEVVFDVEYRRNDVILQSAPSDVGSYVAVFTLPVEANKGNYALNITNITRYLEILQPEITYSVVSTELKYNGKSQNPLINGLHDAEGKLPAGVEVVYTYRSGNQYYTGGVVNVGSYLCEIEIKGGNNYPSDFINTFSLTVSPQDLYVGTSEVGSEYLSEIVSLQDHLLFEGLVGNDKASQFGYVDVYTEAQSYYTLGVYDIIVEGFRLDVLAENLYTERNLSATYEHDGKEYYRLTLKAAGQDGSLYGYVNENGGYVYQDIIDKFNNYNIYVIKTGEYTVYAEPDAVVVGNDAELLSALASVKNGGSAKIYLNAMYDEDGAIVPYKAITINVDADITIIGCYDENKVIQTYMEKAEVLKGSLTLKIIGFKVTSEGSSGLILRSGAGAVSVYDSLFEGGTASYTTGIHVDSGYASKIFVSASEFRNLNRGINLLGGNMEISSSTFSGNNYGIGISSQMADVRVDDSSFEGHIVAIQCDNAKGVMLGNSFRYNTTAINFPKGDANDLAANNTVDETNANGIITEEE